MTADELISEPEFGGFLADGGLRGTDIREDRAVLHELRHALHVGDIDLDWSTEEDHVCFLQTLTVRRIEHDVDDAVLLRHLDTGFVTRIGEDSGRRVRLLETLRDGTTDETKTDKSYCCHIVTLPFIVMLII